MVSCISSVLQMRDLGGRIPSTIGELLHEVSLAVHDTLVHCVDKHGLLMFVENLMRGASTDTLVAVDHF